MFDELQHKLNEVFLFEAIGADKIERAMDLKKRVVIRYQGEDGIPTRRQIEIFAYGLSKAGNPVIRAFQISNSPTAHPTRSGEWKMFRLDRITDLKLTPYDVTEMFPYLKKKLRNRSGDRSMSQVFRVLRPDYEIPDDEAKSIAAQKQALGHGPEYQNNGVIGKYTMKNGEVLNIIGLINTKGGRTIARTDTGGHLFINYNNLDTSGIKPASQQNKSPEAKQEKDAESADWEARFKQGMEDEFREKVAKEANDSLDAISVEPEKGPIKDDESDDNKDYNNENEKQ